MIKFKRNAHFDVGFAQSVPFVGVTRYTVEKEKTIFFTKGKSERAVAKSYMTDGLLMYA
jgi:hypothetical protein